MRGLVYGAGTIGRSIVRRLIGLGHDVAVSDPNGHALGMVDGRAVTICEDGVHNSTLDVDYVVNAGPFTINREIIEFCKLRSISYFDLSEDQGSMQMCKFPGTDHTGPTFMPACGLAPGFVSVLVSSLGDGKKLKSVKIRVGALPQVADNRFRHRPTWSVDGLVNEYLTPGQALYKGKIVTTEPLRGEEEVMVCGHNFDAFNTSGGIGTLHEYYQDLALLGYVDKEINVDYKTLRWPGHFDKLKMLVQEFKITREALVRIFKGIRPPAADVVFISVALEDDQSTTFWEKAYHPIGGETAIQRLTAAGLVAMVELWEARPIELSATARAVPAKVIHGGFMRQEEVPLEEFAKTVNGKEFARFIV